MSGMKNDEGPVIDMTPEGEFVEPPKPKAGVGMFVVRLAVFGLVLCAIGVAFWAAVLLLPVLMLLGVVGYFTLRSRISRPGPPRGF